MKQKNIFGQEIKPLDIELENLKKDILDSREAKLVIRFLDWIVDNLVRIVG